MNKKYAFCRIKKNLRKQVFSKEKIMHIISVLCLVIFVSQLQATNFTSSQTGNWNSSSTWGVGLPDFVLPYRTS